jgi:hypothetical protein
MSLISIIFTEASTEAQQESLLAELRRTAGVTGASRLIEGTNHALISRMAKVEALEETLAALLDGLRRNPLVESANEPAERYSA